MTLVQKEVKKITMRPNGSEVQIRPVVKLPYLCFTAEQTNCNIQLTKYGSPTSVSLETSTDGSTWSDYTIGDTITLSNIGDKVYWRNKSETQTSFSTSSSKYYSFSIIGSIAASGDVNYLLCKNSTTDLTASGQYCFYHLFYNQANLTSIPQLPATILTGHCYEYMFGYCTNIEQLPNLPAITLTTYCYQYMFTSCSKIKISDIQTGEYQTEYRIPTTGTGTTASFALNNMFRSTGGTFTGPLSVNTKYYTSNTIV